MNKSARVNAFTIPADLKNDIEDTARELDFVTHKAGEEYIAWARIMKEALKLWLAAYEGEMQWIEEFINGESE